MGTLADDAAAALDAAGVAKADVFGISMGGMIAQELALRHPQRVRRLALGATFASWLRSKKPAPHILLDLLAALRQRAGHEQLARLLLGPGHLEKPGALEAFARWREACDMGHAKRSAFQVLASLLHSTTRRLSQIRAPTLVLAGDADRLIKPENPAALARAIPGARLHLFPGAGHAFPLECEDAVVAVLEEHFLGGEAAARAAG